MARKPFVVDEAMREKVRYLAGVGVRQDEIARIIGCAPKTLRKRFRDELDLGVAEANATVCGYLFAAAKAGNVTAQHLLAEDAGALAGENGGGCSGGGRPGAARRCRVRIHRCSSCCLITAVMPSSRRCCEMHKKITSPEDRWAQALENQELIARGSEEGQIVPTELAVDTPTDAARNWFPGEGGQSASAPGV